MNRQTGFSLLELMIVISIIGVLSAIAIPAYQHYIAKAQLSEVFVLTNNLKVDIQSHREKNTCTDTAKAPIQGKYGSISITEATQNGKLVCGIRYQFKDQDVSDKLVGLVVAMEVAESGVIYNQNQTTVPSTLLPKAIN